MSSRPVLYSEYVIIQAAYANATTPPPSNISVVREEYAPSRIGANRLFNADFSLWLLHDLPARQNRFIEVIPVRPRSMGAEYFVTIQNDGAPALIELIAGESIPLSSFAGAVERIDAAIGDVLKKSCATVDYLRIAELETGISFLASNLASNSNLSTLTHVSPDRIATKSGELFIRRIGDEKIMIDGFLEH